MEEKRWKHAGCFEGICSRSWNWMHFTLNGIELAILARHQTGAHGCHSYFPGTMNADVEWHRAGTVDTALEGGGEEPRHGLQQRLQYARGLHAIWTQLSSDTMGADFEATHYIYFFFSSLKIFLPLLSGLSPLKQLLRSSRFPILSTD